MEAMTADGRLESDLSPRKLKIAGGALIGDAFGPQLLLAAATSALMLPLIKEFPPASFGGMSFGMGAAAATGLLALWPIGRVIDRWGMRPAMTGVALVAGATALIQSMLPVDIVSVCVCFGVLGVAGAAALAYTKVVAATFTQHRGKALALMALAAWVASILTPVAVQELLSHFDWRTVYRLLGIATLLTIPVLYLTVREPDERGNVARRFLPRRNARPLEGHSIKAALADRVFWLITFATGIVVGAATTSGAAAGVSGKGFAFIDAGWALWIASLVAPIGLLAGGWAADRFQTAKVAIPASLLSAISLVLMVVVTPVLGGVTLLATAMTMGRFGSAMLNPIGTYFTTRYFGLRAFAEISAVLSLLAASRPCWVVLSRRDFMK
jgi:MFS family permease